MKRDFIVPSNVKNKIALKSDAIMAALDKADPDQISSWVDKNIIDIASARKLFKFILMYIKAH